MPAFIIAVIIGTLVLRIFGGRALLGLAGGVMGFFTGGFVCTVLAIFWPDTFWDLGAYIFFFLLFTVSGAIKGILSHP